MKIEKVIKNFLKKSFFHKIYQKYSYYKINHGISKVNVLKTFPAFRPQTGSGNYSLRSKMTIININEVIPILNSYCLFSKKNTNFKRSLEKKLIKNQF